MRTLLADVSSRLAAHELLADVVTGGRLLRGVRILYAEIEKRGLLSGMFAQFCHLVDAAGNSLLLFALIPPLCFVPLSLLAGLFLLPFGKC